MSKPPPKQDLLEGAQPVLIKSFGTKARDDTIYVIRRSGGGMFSILASVLCHLDIADRLQMVPVIDMQNFRGVYNEEHPVNGTINAWEYFYEPVSSLQLGDAYESSRVIISDPGYPAGYSMSIENEPHLYEIYEKYIRFRPDIIHEVEEFTSCHFDGKRVLGIHFRGQEMKTAPGHWLPPSKRQMFEVTQRLLQTYDFDRIFVVSEEAEYVDFLRDAFGDMVFAAPHYRTYKVNAYAEYPRENHRYLLGREIIVDALLLSRCRGLVGCTSNVATFARFVNNGQYVVSHKINNGPNSTNPYIAKYLWSIKSRLPSGLGGFAS
jgi:hypothetical protein